MLSINLLSNLSLVFQTRLVASKLKSCPGCDLEECDTGVRSCKNGVGGVAEETIVGVGDGRAIAV